MVPGLLLYLALAIASSAAGAQESAADSRSASEERKARILELVSRDRGAVTALEPSSLQDGSVIVGYASGEIALCSVDRGCREFSGTPNIPVELIVASRNAEAEVIWASYRQGALYRCVGNQCQKVAADEAQ